MPVIVVEVMPKAELLDPQGKAVAGALGRLGRPAFRDVRVGKRFELHVDGPVTETLLAEARGVAESLLANLVIEDVVSVREGRPQAPDLAALDGAAPVEGRPSSASGQRA